MFIKSSDQQIVIVFIKYLLLIIKFNKIDEEILLTDEVFVSELLDIFCLYYVASGENNLDVIEDLILIYMIYYLNNNHRAERSRWVSRIFLKRNQNGIFNNLFKELIQNEMDGVYDYTLVDFICVNKATFDVLYHYLAKIPQPHQ